MEVDPSVDPVAAIDNYLELENQNNRMARLEIDGAARGAAGQPIDQGAAVQQLPGQQPPAPVQQVIVRQPPREQAGAQGVAAQGADAQQVPVQPVLEQRIAAQEVAAQQVPGQQGAGQQIPLMHQPHYQQPAAFPPLQQQVAAQQVLYQQPGRQQHPGPGAPPVVEVVGQVPPGPGPAAVYNAPRAFDGAFPGPQVAFERGPAAGFGGYRGNRAAHGNQAGGAVGQGAGNQAGGENGNHPYRRSRAGRIVRGRRMMRRFLLAMNVVADEYFGQFGNNNGDDDNHHQHINGAVGPNNQL